MTLDELPHQFAAFLNSARAVFDREVAGARKAVDNLNAEKTAAAKALADLKEQHELAQKQLDAVRADLQRASILVGVGHDIASARKVLETLKSETAQAKAALEKLAKERTAREAEVKVLGDEARRLVAIRTEGEAAMANLRAQLRSVQIGR
jgi:chromosome segregation ATPase